MILLLLTKEDQDKPPPPQKSLRCVAEVSVPSLMKNRGRSFGRTAQLVLNPALSHFASLHVI